MQNSSIEVARASPPLRRVVTAVMTAAIGIALAYHCKISNIIGEPSFIILLFLSALVGLLIAFIDRVRSFNLRDFNVELEKVETTRREVEEREKEVRRIALAISEITVFLAAFHRRLGSEENHELEIQWLKKRVEKLLSESSATEKEKDQAFHFLREVEEMDNIKKTDPEASLARWDAIWSHISSDLKKD